MSVLKRLISLFLTSILLATTVPAVAVAEDSFEGTYVKTFTISAYYSPLPCQERYTTGSYEGDIRLNGSGVNSADGTPVYPGMIAAPKTYDFGTKMHIPGLGTGAVHDRGGAIVNAGQRNQQFDRLDVWMGYGDEGLTRALNWGKRTVDVLVYGIDDTIKEELYLGTYDPSEAIPNECEFTNEQPEQEEAPVIELASEVEIDVIPTEKEEENEPVAYLSANLSRGDAGVEVEKLQRELKDLNYYRASVNGVYDEVTEHAVYKFQQSQGLVADKSSLGAGIAGPKTRNRFNEIISARLYSKNLVAVQTEAVRGQLVADPGDSLSEAANSDVTVSPLLAFNSELDFGMTGDEVSRLQEVLRKEGYFAYPYTTKFFGQVTRDALIEFQLDKGVIKSVNDRGAGRVGPSTLNLLNTLI